MSLENSKDAHDTGRRLSEVGPEFKSEYKAYLYDQLYFHLGVFKQEKAVSFHNSIATENTIDNIIDLLKG